VIGTNRNSTAMMVFSNLYVIKDLGVVFMVVRSW
jgi:hypothetical protein